MVSSHSDVSSPNFSWKEQIKKTVIATSGFRREKGKWKKEDQWERKGEKNKRGKRGTENMKMEPGEPRRKVKEER